MTDITPEKVREWVDFVNSFASLDSCVWKVSAGLTLAEAYLEKCEESKRLHATIEKQREALEYMLKEVKAYHKREKYPYMEELLEEALTLTNEEKVE
jgi:hypothetical protein